MYNIVIHGLTTDWETTQDAIHNLTHWDPTVNFINFSQGHGNIQVPLILHSTES